MVLNILHVKDSLAVGGAEKVLVELANRTFMDGHYVSVCVTRSEKSLAMNLRPEINLWVLGRKWRFDFKAMREFARLVRKNQVNLIQAHSRSTVAFLSVLKTLCMIKAPIIFLDHYGIEINNSVPLWFRWWGKYCLNHYVGVCHALAEWAQKAGIPSKKISVIENALDLPTIMHAVPLEIRKELKIPLDVPIGIMVGGIRHEKGTDILIEALAQCNRAKFAKILIVGGDRDLEFAQRCRNRVKTLGLEETVVFLGERLDVPNLLRAVDFALIPSRSEACNLVFIEYLASALPFVSTKVGGIAQKLSSLGLPEFVSPEDPKSFVGALDRLLNLTPAEWKERGKRGQELSLKYFDIHAKIPQWYKLYEKVLGAATA